MRQHIDGFPGDLGLPKRIVSPIDRFKALVLGQFTGAVHFPSVAFLLRDLLPKSWWCGTHRPEHTISLFQDILMDIVLKEGEL